jgi:hypothetical protein
MRDDLAGRPNPDFARNQLAQIAYLRLLHPCYALPAR